MHKEDIQCLVIDDEPLARQLLRSYIAQRPGYAIAGACTNPAEAYQLLLTQTVDVIFLDIQMPIVNGVDFLRSLKKPPAIIFTTAFDRYAATAFDLNVVDYLMKPITLERFDQALQKLQAALKNDRESIESLPPAGHLFLKADGRLVKVMLHDLLYLEAWKDFTKLYIKGQPPLLVGDHLKAVEALLPVEKFKRIHRSYTVSLQAVTGIFGNTVEIGSIQLPVGGMYRQQLLDSLKIS